MASKPYLISSDFTELSYELTAPGRNIPTPTELTNTDMLLIWYGYSSIKPGMEKLLIVIFRFQKLFQEVPAIKIKAKALFHFTNRYSY